MKIVRIVIVCLLVFLAISSGMTKVTLMEQDVVFFGKYGFTNTLLIAFGAVQVIGGVMLIFFKTRLLGAISVAATFTVSAVMLVMEGDVPFTIATLVALGLLGLTIQRRLTHK